MLVEVAILVHSIFRAGYFDVGDPWAIWAPRQPLTARDIRANRSAEMLVTMHTDLLPPSLRSWFSCQVVVGGALLLSVELVLMTRGTRPPLVWFNTMFYVFLTVYALYNYSASVAYGFGMLFASEIICAIAGVVLERPDKDMKPGTGTETSPNSFIYFGYV